MHMPKIHARTASAYRKGEKSVLRHRRPEKEGCRRHPRARRGTQPCEQASQGTFQVRFPAPRGRQTCRPRTCGSTWTAQSNCRLLVHRSACVRGQLWRRVYATAVIAAILETAFQSRAELPLRPASACSARSKSTGCTRGEDRAGTTQPESAAES